MLTGTCTESLKVKTLEVLNFAREEVETIAVIPDRPNIKLHYHQKPGLHFEEELAWLVEEVKEWGRNTDKHIIYTRYTPFVLHQLFISTSYLSQQSKPHRTLSINIL